ncbi:MAG: hypothetical protein PHG46_02580 [Candidatus Omnitrophica bacterium]|nr:hypothetical protein [Candidatus Omnitrophota bacterium]
MSKHYHGLKPGELNSFYSKGVSFCSFRLPGVCLGASGESGKNDRIYRR